MSLIRQLNAQLIPLDECLTEEVSKIYANQRWLNTVGINLTKTGKFSCKTTNYSDPRRKVGVKRSAATIFLSRRISKTPKPCQIIRHRIARFLRIAPHIYQNRDLEVIPPRIQHLWRIGLSQGRSAQHICSPVWVDRAHVPVKRVVQK